MVFPLIRRDPYDALFRAASAPQEIPRYRMTKVNHDYGAKSTGLLETTECRSAVTVYSDTGTA